MKWMKITGIVLGMVIGLIGCGKISTGSMNTTDIKVTERQLDVERVDRSSDEKILIAYFTWADNTIVKDEEAAVRSALEHYDAMGDADQYGVDAISSASVVQPGNTAMMAKWIQEEIGGNLFSIQVKEPYPSDYNDCMDRASEEKADNARPELKTQIKNFEQYDTIFLGFPNWWSSLPMPIHTFLESYDFSGKTVVPFCAHGTGGVAATVRELENVLPENTELLKVLGVYRADILEGRTDVQVWLKELGFVQ